MNAYVTLCAMSPRYTPIPNSFVDRINAGEFVDRDHAWGALAFDLAGDWETAFMMLNCGQPYAWPSIHWLSVTKQRSYRIKALIKNDNFVKSLKLWVDKKMRRLSEIAQWIQDYSPRYQFQPIAEYQLMTEAVAIMFCGRWIKDEWHWLRKPPEGVVMVIPDWINADVYKPRSIQLVAAMMPDTENHDFNHLWTDWLKVDKERRVSADTWTAFSIWLNKCGLEDADCLAYLIMHNFGRHDHQTIKDKGFQAMLYGALYLNYVGMAGCSEFRCRFRRAPNMDLAAKARRSLWRYHTQMDAWHHAMLPTGRKMDALRAQYNYYCDVIAVQVRAQLASIDRGTASGYNTYTRLVNAATDKAKAIELHCPPVPQRIGIHSHLTGYEIVGNELYLKIDGELIRGRDRLLPKILVKGRNYR